MMSLILSRARSVVAAKGLPPLAMTLQRGQATNRGAAYDDDYVYLPPGSSMKDPVTISMSETYTFTDPAPGSEYVTVLGKIQPPANTPAEEKPHPYKMVDEYSQQTYVYSSTHSMREPRYVSITDPVYMTSDKK